MKKYITEFKRSDGHIYGGIVYGNTFEEAQANADLVCEGKVIGELGMIIDEFGEIKYDASAENI